MELKGPENIRCDVLVIGSGAAGLEAAIKARERGVSVLLVSKSQTGLGSNTALSGAAFAAATGEREASDGPAAHHRDIIEGGRFINDPYLVDRFTRKVIDEVPLLQQYGVPFQKDKDRVAISRAPGHSYARHFHGTKRIGTIFSLPLSEHASRIGVRLAERVFVTRLMTRNGAVVGAAGIDRDGRLLVFQSPVTILATGGAGQVYLHTNNATGMTGDGYALGFQLGVPLRDMEFVQFYPTAILGIRMLIYETFVFRHGAIIRNSRGEDVIVKHSLQDPMRMTRDRLAQAIMREILAGNDVNGGVIIDLSPLSDDWMQRLRHLLPANAGEKKRKFQVAPTVHFYIGGLVTNVETGTGVDGLLACGEVVGGAHGANRLAGNALAECFAMGAVAGENAARLATDTSPVAPDPAEVSREKSRLESLMGGARGDAAEVLRSLKELAWYNVGILRNRRGLEEARKAITDLRSQVETVRSRDVKGLVRRLELDNMLLVAEMVAWAALERTESRGAHFREDYPDEDPAWQANIFITNRGGEIALERKPAATVKD